MQELYATIAALPEDFRLTLVAVDVLGLSYREAARALKVREATITTRLFRARRQVSAQLGVPEGGGAEPTPRRAAGAAGAPAAAPAADASAPGAREEKKPSGVLQGRSTR
jgi:Sigma-70, region 4